MAQKISTFNGFSNSHEDECIIDKSMNQPACSNGPDYSLRYFNSFYVHGFSGSLTKFKRRIVLTYCDATGNTVPNANLATETLVDSLSYWGNSSPAVVINNNCTITINNCSIGAKCISVEAVLTDR